MEYAHIFKFRILLVVQQITILGRAVIIFIGWKVGVRFAVEK
jgi:hypothetical protein